MLQFACGVTPSRLLEFSQCATRLVVLLCSWSSSGDHAPKKQPSKEEAHK